MASHILHTEQDFHVELSPFTFVEFYMGVMIHMIQLMLYAAAVPAKSHGSCEA